MKKFTKVCMWTALVTVGMGIILVLVGASLGGFRQSREALRAVRSRFPIPFVTYWNDWAWGWDDDYDDYDYDYDYDYDHDYDYDYDYDYHYDYDYDDEYDEDGDEFDGGAGSGSPVYFNTEEDICDASGVNKIKVKVRHGVVNIKPYDGSTYRYESSVSNYFQVYMNNDKLYIYSDKRTRNTDKYRITLFVPESASPRKIDVALGEGICAIDDMNVPEMDVEAGAGQVLLNNIKVDEADFGAGAGELKMSGSIGRKLDVNCGVGTASLTLENSRDEFNYEVECAVGNVRIDSDRYSGLGTTRKFNNNAAKKIDIECGVGDVDIQFNK